MVGHAIRDGQVSVSHRFIPLQRFINEYLLVDIILRNKCILQYVVWKTDNCSPMTRGKAVYTTIQALLDFEIRKGYIFI
jgi:hypothetical protein